MADGKIWVLIVEIENQPNPFERSVHFTVKEGSHENFDRRG